MITIAAVRTVCFLSGVIFGVVLECMNHTPKESE